MHKIYPGINKIKHKIWNGVTYIKNDTAYFVFKSTLFHGVYGTIEVNY